VTNPDWHGLPCVRVAADRLTATVVPTYGGKIVSLLTDTGMELLTICDLGGGLPGPVAGFVDVPMGGWDECVPTIDACHVSGFDDELPDHGEAWRMEWQPQGQGWYGFSGRTMPYEFARRVRVWKRGLRLEYRASATSDHPAQLADVGYGKCYIDPEHRVDHAALARPDGTTLHLTWDASATPYLGVWMERAVYADEHVVVIEPSTGYFDSCARAQALGRVPVLEPGQTQTWYVDLDATTA